MCSRFSGCENIWTEEEHRRYDLQHSYNAGVVFPLPGVTSLPAGPARLGPTVRHQRYRPAPSRLVPRADTASKSGFIRPHQGHGVIRLSLPTVSHV